MLNFMYPAWSKCLVGFAALLSPMQALQGTHALCPFIAADHEACHDRATTDVADGHCCGHADSGCQRRRVDSGRPVIQDDRHPATPCSCPTTCICYSHRLPQLPGNEPVRVERPVEFVFLSEFLPDTNGVAGAAAFQSQFSAPIHTPCALQMCAHLGRFLA